MDKKYMEIEKLLPLFCEGKLTEEENAVVEAWVEEDESHKKILQDMLELCLSIDAHDVMTGVDTEQALKRVKAKIHSRRNRVWLGHIQRFAAILSIPLALMVMYLGMKDLREDMAEAEEPVRMMEFRTNAGMTGKVILPDGSTAILNSGSVLKYPSTFADDGSRQVTFEGEAFFDIVKDELHPFIIATSGSEKIKVYGTTFNLEAYSGENTITTLLEGSVGFTYSDQRGVEHEVMLKPNHKLEFNPVCKMLSVKETSCLAETAWKDGKVILDKTPLKDILRSLSKRFNVRFSIKNVELESLTFSGGLMTLNSLEHTLEALKIASGLEWRYIPFDDLNSRQVIEIY